MGTKAKMTISRAVSILNREKPVFLEGLSPAEVQMVVAKAGVRRYAANDVITNEASGATHLFLLLEGAGRGYALTSRGEKIGLGWFPAGSIMGWASLVSKPMDYIVSMEAAASSSALVWDRVTIQSFAAALPRLLENAMRIAYEYVVIQDESVFGSHLCCQGCFRAPSLHALPEMQRPKWAWMADQFNRSKASFG